MLNMKLPRNIIRQIRDGILDEVYLDITDKTKKDLKEKARILDSDGNILNREAKIRFSAWEDSDDSVKIVAKAIVKPGDVKYGTDPHSLYYVLRIYGKMA